MPENILARLRKERGLSQSQLAAASGVHVQNISKIERGDMALANLRLSTALKLADALQVDPHLFLEDTGSQSLVFE